jgi:tRNA dimethylallyltransferase
MSKLPKIIVIIGPTASGKTALSLELAKKYNGEVVNADSRQVYRQMNIGTAKLRADKTSADSEYLAEGVRHHLIDICDPDEHFSLALFKERAFLAIDDIISRGKLPIVVGGTGLYVKAIVENFDIPVTEPNQKVHESLATLSLEELTKKLEAIDPATAQVIDLKNPRRVMRALEYVLTKDLSFIAEQKTLPPKYEVLEIGLAVPREVLVERINWRVEEQIKDGLVEEVAKLAEKYSWDLPSMSGIGYKQIGYYLRNELSLAEASALIKRDTRQYAKRQMTWFKRDFKINWVTSLAEAAELVEKFVK